MAGPPTTVDTGGGVVVVVMGGSVDGGVKVVVGATPVVVEAAGAGSGVRTHDGGGGRVEMQSAWVLACWVASADRKLNAPIPTTRIRAAAEGVLDERRPSFPVLRVPVLLTTHRALLGPTSVFLARSTVSPIAERPL